MTANLEEHPPAWLERFRPPGTDLGVVPTPWIYDVMVRDFERARSLS